MIEKCCKKIEIRKKKRSYLKMFSKDLMNLIDNYKEDGFFFIYDSEVIWSNGKRYELWCTNRSLDRVLNYKYELYGQMHTGELVIFKHNQWTVLNECQLERDLIQFQHQIIIYKNVEIPKYFYAITHILLKDEIYFFSAFKNIKYDMITKKEIPFANSPFHYGQIFLFHELFYWIVHDKISIYDPKLDLWSLPKKIKISY